MAERILVPGLLPEVKRLARSYMAIDSSLSRREAVACAFQPAIEIRIKDINREPDGDLFLAYLGELNTISHEVRQAMRRIDLEALRA